MKKVTLKIVMAALTIALLGVSVSYSSKSASASDEAPQTQIVKHDEAGATEAAKIVESFDANNVPEQIVEQGKVKVSKEDLMKQDVWCEYQWYCNMYGYCFYRYVCVR
jgi:hypothetical protein